MTKNKKGISEDLQKKMAKALKASVKKSKKQQVSDGNSQLDAADAIKEVFNTDESLTDEEKKELTEGMNKVKEIIRDKMN